MSRFIPNSTMIPNAFFDEVMQQLSDKALRAYLIIARKTTGWGKEWDSISISQFIQFSGLKDERTIRAGLNELIEFGLIKPLQVVGHPTKYALVTDAAPPASDVPPTWDVPPASDVSNPLHWMQGDPLHGMSPTKTINKTNNTKTNNTKTNKTELDDAFNEFYSAYPKKVGKEPALRSWKKIKPALYETIIADVKNRAANHIGWQDKQFIPNPATYLNQKRWEDELNPIRQPQKNNVHPINQPRSQMLAGVRFGNF